jgi:hypothetical protein
MYEYLIQTAEQMHQQICFTGSVSQETKFSALFFNTFGVTEGYLSEHSVSVAFNGAAVMLGNHSGVQKMIRNFALLMYRTV